MARKKQKDTAEMAAADMPMIDAGDESSSESATSFGYSLGGNLQIDVGNTEDEEDNNSVLLSEYTELESGETPETITRKHKTKDAEEDEEGTATTAGRDPFLEGYVASGGSDGWDAAYE